MQIKTIILRDVTPCSPVKVHFKQITWHHSPENSNLHIPRRKNVHSFVSWHVVTSYLIVSCIGFHVLTAVTTKSTIFWGVATCSLVKVEEFWGRTIITFLWYDTDRTENHPSNYFTTSALKLYKQDTHRQQGDLISLLFIQNKESRLKMTLESNEFPPSSG
jgi:hypothetical protein